VEMGKSPWGMCVDTRFGRVVDAERVNGILSRLVSDGARSVLVGTTDGTDVTSSPGLQGLRAAPRRLPDAAVPLDAPPGLPSACARALGRCPQATW